MNLCAKVALQRLKSCFIPKIACSFMKEMTEIQIKRIKDSFSKSYPHSALAIFLLNAPDAMPVAEFLGAVSVWLVILDLEKSYDHHKIKSRNKWMKLS